MSSGTSPMWLSHHWPDQHVRCIHRGQLVVCRRCAVLYPTAVATAVIASIAAWPALEGSGSVVALVISAVLVLPTVIEWVGEHNRGWGYEPRRQAVLSVPCGIACGLMLTLLWRDMADPTPWAFGGVVGLLCGLSALWGLRSKFGDPHWEKRFEAAEQQRLSALRELALGPTSRDELPGE